MAREVTQQTQRRDVRPADQWGRLYFGSIEISTGDFTGQINCGKWVDPIRTPQKYLETPSANGMPLGTIVINYERWRNETEQAESEWYEQLLVCARVAYKQMDPNDVPHLENDPFVRGMAGPKPWPSSKVIQEAADGDPMYLGLEPLDDAHKTALGISLVDRAKIAARAKVKLDRKDPTNTAIPAAPERYQDFITWDMKYETPDKPRAKNLSEAAAHWKERKTAKVAG